MKIRNTTKGKIKKENQMKMKKSKKDILKENMIMMIIIKKAKSRSPMMKK